MAFWLNAWNGDGAGGVLGREPYRALISMTCTDGVRPPGIYQSGDLNGTTWFYNFSAACLTPGSMPAIVTRVDEVGDLVWSVEVTPHDWGDKSLSNWAPGVHLFSLMLFGPGGDESGTIASVIVPKKQLKPMLATPLMAQRMLAMRRSEPRS